MKKANAESHAGRERLRRQQASAALDDAVKQAAERVAPASGVALALPRTAVPQGRRVLHLEAAAPPYPAEVTLTQFLVPVDSDGQCNTLLKA
ncbi:hypothetical protein D3C72_2359080 [compost metagenome]